MRSWLVAGLVALANPSLAQVQPGPHPNTVTSRNGELIWYTGMLPIEGRRWGDMDRICGTVPVAGVSGWRAPAMSELQTLLIEVRKNNGIATWVELYLADEALMAPAIPPFLHGARLHPQMNMVSGDLYTYEGHPARFDQVVRGRMYTVHWFNRWTHPFIDRERSIRHNPANQPFGAADRLLCVARRA